MEFKTGEKYEIGFLNVGYEGVFIGTLREATIGTFSIKDINHGFSFKTKIGHDLEKRPKDYFIGHIDNKNGKAVCGVFGTYLGYVNFEGVRYWDGRKTKPFRLQA